MKKIVLLLLPLFFLGCEGSPDSYPVEEIFDCTFTNLHPKKYLRISFECLERKQKDAGFSLSIGAKTPYTSNNEDNVIIVPKKAIESNGNIFNCLIRLYPYFPISFSKEQQDNYVGTKLTYIMRIYKDEDVVYKKVLKYPKKEYSVIKIDL